MKNRFKSCIIVLCAICLLCGCTKTLSCTFTLSTGSVITVALDASGNYSMKESSGSIAITQSGSTVVTGDWYQRSLYEAATSSLSEQGIEEDVLAGFPCWYFTDSDSGYASCLVLLDTNTCLLLQAERLSITDLQEVISLLSFEVQ